MHQMCLFEVKFSFNRNNRSLLLKAGTRQVMHLKNLSVLGYSRQQTVLQGDHILLNQKSKIACTL